MGPVRPAVGRHAGHSWDPRETARRAHHSRRVLALSRDRMTTVRTLVDGLTEVSLVAHTEPVDRGGLATPWRASRCVSGH